MKVQRIKTTGKYRSVLELIKRVNSMYYRGCMTQTEIANKTKTSRYIVRKILKLYLHQLVLLLLHLQKLTVIKGR